ncbi:50S ribosomal protein L22 [Candidatus Wolfebacteria bacterium]|nr:MAG: 50S ribosomal protein L22 [Candidatus Wolfebacteria bacterium]
MITATLSKYRQAPRKVRLVTELIKGKTVEQALVLLDTTTKNAGQPLKKLLVSAIANAKHNAKLKSEDLMIKNITVDKAPVIKRFRPRARGRASSIHKHSSHVTLTLDTIAPKKEKAVAKKVEKKAPVAKKESAKKAEPNPSASSGLGKAEAKKE